jgi:hypothetical protein
MPGWLKSPRRCRPELNFIIIHFSDQQKFPSDHNPYKSQRQKCYIGSQYLSCAYSQESIVLEYEKQYFGKEIKIFI